MELKDPHSKTVDGILYILEKESKNAFEVASEIR
jgi:hypothetical protein